MENPFKPEGYNSLSAYFVVDGAQKFIDLMEKLFGAIILRRYIGPNGRVLHVELKIDDTVIMAADSNDPNRRGSFRDFAGNYWSVATQVKKD